jgi:hypothetical protein
MAIDRIETGVRGVIQEVSEKDKHHIPAPFRDERIPANPSDFGVFFRF